MKTRKEVKAMSENELSLLSFSDEDNDTTRYIRDYDKALLSTFDNPFDPFEEDLKWSAYDEQLGYFTSRRVAALIGEPSEFEETGLGKTVEARLLYSAQLDILRSSANIPYVLVFPYDYTNGRFIYYNPNVEKEFKGRK